MIVDFSVTAQAGSTTRESNELYTYSLPSSVIANEELLVFEYGVSPNPSLVADSFEDTVMSTITFENGIVETDSVVVYGYFLKRKDVFSNQTLYQKDGYPSATYTATGVLSETDNYFYIYYYGSGHEGWDGATMVFKFYDVDTHEYVGLASCRLYVSRWLASSYRKFSVFIEDRNGSRVMSYGDRCRHPIILDIIDGKMGFYTNGSRLSAGLDLSGTSGVFDVSVVISHMGSWYGVGGALYQKRKKIPE